MVVSESLYLHFRSNQTSSFLPKLEATNDELTWFGMHQFLCFHNTSFFLFSKQYQPWSDIWLFIGWILGRKIWTKVGYKSTSHAPKLHLNFRRTILCVSPVGMLSWLVITFSPHIVPLVLARLK